MQKPIPGFPGYEITDDGRVWSVVRARWMPLHVGGNSRYQQVMLHTDRGYRPYSVHRLVLEAFVGPSPEGMEACHNNGIRTDNRLENLRWDTRSNSHRDKIRHGTLPDMRALSARCPRGQNCPWARFTDGDIRDIRLLRDLGVPGTTLGQMYGVSKNYIYRICGRMIWRSVA
jgi:hypothetical protein